MNENTENNAAPESAPAAAAPAAAPDLEKTIAELREEVAESRRTAEFWATQARSTPAAPAQPQPQPEPEEEDDTDVLEAITTEGTKGFDRLAAKRGFIKRTEVEQLIDARATAIQTAHSAEQELLTTYPDLKNRQSDFFKTTATHYGQLVKSGTPPATAMGVAASMAELEFMRAGKLSTPNGAKGDREADRLARINAQGGGAGPRRPSGAETDDDTLTPEQKHIAAMMGISEEAYLKRAKTGVQMGGKTK
jgi:hypothetical protein